MATPIEILKFKLQERQNPFFEDEELAMLLEENDSNVNKAAWKGCLLKSATESKIKVGPIEITNVENTYWQDLAEEYHQVYLEEKALEDGSNLSTSRYINRMRRM